MAAILEKMRVSPISNDKKWFKQSVCSDVGASRKLQTTIRSYVKNKVSRFLVSCVIYKRVQSLVYSHSLNCFRHSFGFILR